MCNKCSYSYDVRLLPRHEGSIVKRGFIIIKPIEELRFGGARGGKSFGTHTGGRTRGQFVLSRGSQGFLGSWICGLETLMKEKIY